MRNRILFLFLFSSAFNLVKSQTVSENPSNFFMGHFGGGASSISGWSAFCSFSFERKNNEFTIRGVFNSERGKRVPDFIGYEYYNDRYSDAAVMYGRAFRKNVFFASVSAGPSYYKYTDQFLVKDTVANNWLNNDFAVRQKRCTGIGLACESKLIMLITEEVGIGILLWGDINSCYSVSGVSLSMTFGYLRN